jgi:hypothetical protein
MSLKEEKLAKSTEFRKTLSKLGLSINTKNPSLTLKKFIQIYIKTIITYIIQFNFKFKSIQLITQRISQ